MDDPTSDLQHPKVKPLTRQIASKLGLEPKFIEFVFAERRASCFDYWVGSLEGTWTCGVPDDVEVAYPLWATSSDQTLLCIGPDGIRFVHGYHDEPEVDPIARTVQGLLTSLFIQLYSNDATKEELRAATSDCGFRHLEEIFALENAPVSDAEFSELVDNLSAKIDAIYLPEDGLST